MTIPPDWINVVIALVAALGGVAGIAALINSITAAKKSEVEALRLVVQAVQAENQRLRERNQELEREYRWARREIAVLRNALTEAGIKVPEFRPREDL